MKDPLSGSARERLFSRVASTRDPGGDAGADASGAVAKGGDEAEALARFTDFTTLPGMDELRLQRALGERFGLVSPYFRTHEGRLGARTRIDGRELLNFAGYDYLGLNGHPEVVEVAKAALDRYGVSASGSRHVAGERPAHRTLERALADLYRADDALVFVSGYATNVGTIGQLVGARDLVVSDAAIHNSAAMGSVLSGAARRTFPHGDLDALEELLGTNRPRFERALIVVEGLYSMDGDFPDLPRLIEIKKRHHAWLMVDEAHALGVLGAGGRGLAEHFGVDPREVDIWMGTVSKTLSGCGGYIAGTAAMVEYLRLFAGAFVYSVAMPPAVAASAEKALEIMLREPDRVARLQANGAFFRGYARERGLDTGFSEGFAVTPVLVGDSVTTVMLAQELFQRGLNVLPVLYPAVPMQGGRLRFFLTAMHSEDDMRKAIDVTAELLTTIRERLRVLRSAT